MTLLAALSVASSDLIPSMFIISLFYLPILCLVVYLIHHMLKCCCCCACVTQNAFSKSSHNNPSKPSEQLPLLIPPITRTVVGLGDYAEDDEYPDRMVHPDGYT